MPNHVTTAIKAEDKILHALIGEDGNVDFNKIIPMPTMDDPIFTSERTDCGNGMVGYGLKGFSPLDWAREYWGTKWNAYESEVSEGSVQFQTAWNTPKPVFDALTSMFPGQRIEILWADENLGSNIGHVVWDNGEWLNILEFGECTDKAYEFAYQLIYGEPEWDA